MDLSPVTAAATNPVNIAAVCTLLGIAAKVWRDDRIKERESQERREQLARELVERREDRDQASKERRATTRQIRKLRPDSYCADRGCPLTDGPLQEVARKMRSSKA